MGRADASAALSGAQQQLGGAKARLATAQANVRVAEANYAKAAADLQRYKLLVDKDEISKQQYDQAVAAAEAAHATLDAQKAQVNEAQQNISAAEDSIKQARARVDQAEATVSSAMTGPEQVKVTEAKVQSMAARVEQQRALLAQAELNVQYTTIIAPVAGIVARKNVEVGNNVSPGQQLMAVVPVEGTDHGKFQGDAASENEGGAAGEDQSGRLRSRIQRQSAAHGRRERREDELAAAGERDRKLRKSSPADSGSHRARSRSERRSSAAAWNVGSAGGAGPVSSSTTLPAPPPVAPEVWKSKHNPWIIALVVTMATFMEVLDTSIANVALPHIAGSLSASTDESAWVLSSYLVANAVILPISAWLATRFGRTSALHDVRGAVRHQFSPCADSRHRYRCAGFLPYVRLRGGGLRPLTAHHGHRNAVWRSRFTERLGGAGAGHRADAGRIYHG